MQIHIIAVGEGIMYSLAQALQRKGDQVSGSDEVSYISSQVGLTGEEVLPEVLGWFPEKIVPTLDAVILGAHVKTDNPELLRAQELGLKIYSYAEFLYEHSKHKTRVVIGGSHGKTMIVAMILHVMTYHDRSVDYVIGAQSDGAEERIHLTEENDFMVLEGDGNWSSAIDQRPRFHLYRPNIALLSSMEWEKSSAFPTLETYMEQFRVFVDSVVKGGSITYNEEDPNIKQLVEASENTIRKLTYSTPEYSEAEGETILETPDGPMPIDIHGEQNLNNLAGAKWICQNMGLDEEDFYEAIATFTGVFES